MVSRPFTGPRRALSRPRHSQARGEGSPPMPPTPSSSLRAAHQRAWPRQGGGPERTCESGPWHRPTRERPDRASLAVLRPPRCLQAPHRLTPSFSRANVPLSTRGRLTSRAPCPAGFEASFPAAPGRTISDHSPLGRLQPRKARCRLPQGKVSSSPSWGTPLPTSSCLADPLPLL